MKKTTLTKPAPAWHAEAMEILQGNFSRILAQFCDGNKRAIWMGIFFIYIKTRGKADDSIPHGQFMNWLKTKFPEAKPRTARSWMLSAEETLEDAEVQIGNFCHFALGGQLQLSEFWTADLDKLPPPIRAMRERIDEAIENRGKNRMLVLSSKQVEKGADGEDHVKRGRLLGEGGRPPELKGTIEEIAAALKKGTRRHCFKAGDELEKAGINFIGMDDGEITACAAAYERTAKCMNAWLAMPAAKRDAKVIQKLWKTL